MNDSYEAALYLRLSKEDGDKIESDSIATQRAILHQFADDNNIAVFQEYIDDGFTGTHFNRPDFIRMIQDAADKKINCIIVKDLSRFGRDYIETGRYLERFFPENDIRFISVNDHIDSCKTAYDMILPFKNIFNEQYARDISTKVQSAFKAKQKKGDFIGAFPTYGYMKDPADKHRLIVDEYAAAIVRRIFHMYVDEGKGQIAISNQLNNENIPCPSEYKKQSGFHYTNGRKINNTTYWTYSTIHRMLNNQMYLGDMVQGKSVRKTHNSKAKLLPKDDWIIIRNTHEAIIEQGSWDKAQLLMKKNIKHPDFGSDPSALSGFIVCGDCGRGMAKNKVNGIVYFKCGSNKRYGSKICKPHTIRESVLKNILIKDFNRVLGEISDLHAIYDKGKPSNISNSDALRAEINKTQTSLEKVKRMKLSLYEDYREGVLSKNEYLEYKENYDKEEAALRNKLAVLANSVKNEESALENPWVTHLLKYRQVEEMDRQILLMLVERITIFEDNVIQIRYNFSNKSKLLPEKEEVYLE